MIRKILQKEDPALHKVCHPVTSFDRKLGALLDDLTATLKDAQGLGLAAPQIGILRRVCVVMDEDEQYLELVNPVIVSQEGEQEGYERAGRLFTEAEVDEMLQKAEEEA